VVSIKQKGIRQQGTVKNLDRIEKPNREYSSSMVDKIESTLTLELVVADRSIVY
jgi:hypothetical protein